MFDKPLYLRGFQPARRNRVTVSLGVVFVIGILVVNYLVFFRSEGTVEPTLDQRLARPVAVPDPSALPEPVPEKPRLPPVTNLVEGRMIRGENGSRTLVRLGADPYSAGRALAAVSRFVNMRTLRIGQRWKMDLRPDGVIQRLVFPVDRVKYIEAVLDDEGSYVSRRREIETDKELIQVACMIRDSLYNSLDRCGVERAVGRLATRMLEGQIDFFTDSRRGDVLRMIVVKESIDGKFLRWGMVRGLLYEGRAVTASAFPVEGEKGVKYYDAQGQSVIRPFLRSPVRYTRVSSRYSERRLHPILHNYTPHRALDYAAPIGTSVYSVGEGTVSFRGWKGASGRLVVIRHANGFQSYYAHLHRIAKGLRVGDHVSRGTFIGTVGKSGRATGPHLHFAVARDGKFVNPDELLTAPGPSIAEDEKMDFMAYVGRMVGRLKALSVRGADGSRS
ncbi:MAG: M23 family metallopeptidase [Deltaproteobacteria bacterium]|nr:M23 family metallopeptidase [Deltaproteobacteria bacterium]